MDLAYINTLSHDQAFEAFFRCCGSKRWAEAMCENRPFSNEADLLAAVEKHWFGLAESDWLEAFDQHPKIGQKKIANQGYSDSAWSKQEQAGMAEADTATADELAVMNQRYLEKFGFIFIVCATGKSAQEMLDLIQGRIKNTRAEELKIAAQQQHQITLLRLEKLS